MKGTARSMLAAALLMAAGTTPGIAAAEPSGSDSASARISLTIPPRVEIRTADHAPGSLCARALGAAILEVRTEDGRALPSCGDDRPQLEVVSADARTLLVTPV